MQFCENKVHKQASGAGYRRTGKSTCPEPQQGWRRCEFSIQQSSVWAVSASRGKQGKRDLETLIGFNRILILTLLLVLNVHG